jgi:hypothetical protein
MTVSMSAGLCVKTAGARWNGRCSYSRAEARHSQRGEICTKIIPNNVKDFRFGRQWRGQPSVRIYDRLRAVICRFAFFDGSYPTRRSGHI